MYRPVTSNYAPIFSWHLIDKVSSKARFARVAQVDAVADKRAARIVVEVEFDLVGLIGIGGGDLRSVKLRLGDWPDQVRESHPAKGGIRVDAPDLRQGQA